MKIEGIIFDFDGTLFSSMHIWRSLAVKVLERNGIKTNEDVNKLIYNMNIREAADFMVKHYGVSKTPNEILQETEDILKKAYNEEIQPKPGVLEFLQRMKVQGVKMCIATATDHYLVEAALKRCHMLHYFENIFTCSEVGYGKDHPYIYNHAVAFLQTNMSETAVFEDAYYAAKTAKLAGFKLVGIYDEYEPQQNELKEISDIYLTDFLLEGETLWT